MVIWKKVPVVSLNWIVMALLVCSCLSLQTGSQICHTDDLLALKEFADNLSNGSVISTWSNKSNCCQWDGVRCESVANKSVANRVIGLELSRKGLKGRISKSLGKLDQLKLLDLSFNHLEGLLPSDLSNLKKLENLDLGHNMLSGAVWGVFGGLKSIQLFNISSNLFSGNFSAFGGFPNLVAFNISSNNFTGSINPQVCEASPTIKVFDISMNHISGGLEGLTMCTKSLQKLHLDWNSLSGELPDFLYNMPTLEQLSLSYNSISGPISSKLSKLSSLKLLVLCGNQLSGSLPNVFENLTKLEQLVAHSNSFSGSLPSTLELCSKLQILDLRNNSLSGSVSLDFNGLPNLSVLDLASNHLSGYLPESLSSCHELKMLSLAKNEFKGQIPAKYMDLSSLTFLTLSNNSLVNISSALSLLQDCKNLSTLILTKNFHGEELPIDVQGFEHLTIFALGNCGLKGQIPSWLSHCRSLEVLDLSWNHLDGRIPTWIGEMENLFYLDFSNNSLSGEIPKSLTELKSLISGNKCMSSLNSSFTGIPLFVKRNQSSTGLQYNQVSSFPPSILLSNNNINGTIWSEIGKLKQLHVLDLSKNNITGIIPSSIGDMTNLEVLDLSYNALNGSIPSSLNQLTFLSKFSVANNYLQGPIPTGGQFFSFPNSSFEGNPGLCRKDPCSVEDLNVHPTVQSSSKRKFGGRIFGITISIGIGVALLLAILAFRMSRRDGSHPIEDIEDEFSRAPRMSDACGPSKLVLFHTAECKDLTVADLLKSTNNFNQSNIVGCGGFGLVFKADMPDGSKAAVKRLSGECGQMEREFQAEVEALSRAQHKNLVSLQGYCRYGNDRLLIYSYMENGSLDYWLHEKIDGGSFLKWETRLRIAQGAARGLSYLHKEPNIIHRDIKTSNILLDERFEAHLADFGLSRLLRPYDTHVTTDLVGTLGYIPPEYSQTLIATFRGDVYSFGIVLLELLTGRRPVEVCKGKNCRDLVSWVFEMKLAKREAEVFDPSIWSKDKENQILEVLNIACRCINQDPKERPSIDQVVTWLDDIGSEKACNEFS
ncbi:hypothetical protein Leryth_025625 [Lithospermum erythrorhizon]|nr:hypothetical protein Leryth_025625 [Lithospermum erythrorhizon]